MIKLNLLCVKDDNPIDEFKSEEFRDGYVNENRIIAFCKTESGDNTIIEFDSGDTFTVKESIDLVAKKIKSSYSHKYN